MQHKLVMVLLIVIFIISISQKESFAPVIPSGNMSDNAGANGVQQPDSIILQSNLWYVMIIVGVIIGVILIYFVMIRNQKSRAR